MSQKNPRIVVEHDEKDGIRIRIDNAFSPEHAVWMLSQAIGTIVTPEVKEDDEEGDVQELSDADGEKEEADVSELPN